MIEFPGQDPRSNRFDYGIANDGTPFFRFVIVSRDLPDNVFDLTSVLSLPNLATPFVEGLKNYLESISVKARQNALRSFKKGFLTYLIRHHPDASLEQLDQQTLTDYVRWQDSPDARVNGDAPLSSESARSHLTLARAVLRGLLKSPRWKSAAERALEVFPQRTHISRERSAGYEKYLPMATLQDVLRASLVEIAEIERRLDEGDALLDAGRRQLLAGNRDYEDLSVAFAQMVEYYPRLFPVGPTLMREHPELGKHIYYGRKERHGLTHLARYRYAQPRDLVAIVLALAIEGAYNPETTLSLVRSDVTPRTVFGVSVINIDGPKGRASNGRYPKDLDPEVVGPWLSLLTRLTNLLRDAANAANRDRLFIFAHDRRRKRISSFGGAATYSSDSIWKWALKDFRGRHDLPHFTLSQIRNTMLDATGERRGSLVAHLAANHKSFDTTDGHYLGPGTRARERDRLGETVQQMERFFESKGTIDVRRAARSPAIDKGAATPGFDCDDPYDSPIVGQIEHRLCRAYGMCPICPMANADNQDAESVALWIGLSSAIQKARDHLDPQHWLDKWAPVAACLLSLLSEVPKAVMANAALISIDLPSVA